MVWPKEWNSGRPPNTTSSGSRWFLAGTPEGADALARSLLGRVLDLPSEDRQEVLETARTWLAVAGSTSEATAVNTRRDAGRSGKARLCG